MIIESVTPQELGQVLDVAARAPTTLQQGFQLVPVLTKLINLANQPHPIGVLVPPVPPGTDFSNSVPQACSQNAP